MSVDAYDGGIQVRVFPSDAYRSDASLEGMVCGAVYFTDVWDHVVGYDDGNARGVIRLSS